MRVEPYGVDSFLHIVKRGARGLPITRDERDRKRFLQLLSYLNDEYQSEFWEQDIRHMEFLERPSHWPQRKPLVHIVAYTLMPNHFHLLLKEIQEGGIARFMQRLGGSMSRYHNEKYDEHGSLFQGPYRSRTIDTDNYLRWVLAYIEVKNVFELYPGGFDLAVREFEKAWECAKSYQYSSLGKHHSAIVDEDIVLEIFKRQSDFKEYAREVVEIKLDFECRQV